MNQYKITLWTSDGTYRLPLSTEDRYTIKLAPSETYRIDYFDDIPRIYTVSGQVLIDLMTKFNDADLLIFSKALTSLAMEVKATSSLLASVSGSCSTDIMIGGDIVLDQFVDMAVDADLSISGEFSMSRVFFVEHWKDYMLADIESYHMEELMYSEE